jgi:hypothetical protein
LTKKNQREINKPPIEINLWLQESLLTLMIEKIRNSEGHMYVYLNLCSNVSSCSNAMSQSFDFLQSDIYFQKKKRKLRKEQSQTLCTINFKKERK